MENQEQQAPLKAPIADFMQQPFWGSDDKIDIKGSDFEIMYNFIQMFGPAVDAARRTMQNNLNSGNIKMRYVKEDGTEVPRSYVVEFEQKWNAYLEELKKQSDEIKAEQGLTGEPEKSNIVNMHNEPVSSAELNVEETPEAVENDDDVIPTAPSVE